MDSAIWIPITALLTWVLAWWFRGRVDAAMLQAGASEKLALASSAEDPDDPVLQELARQAALLSAWAERVKRGPYRSVGLRLRNRVRVARWRRRLRAAERQRAQTVLQPPDEELERIARASEELNDDVLERLWELACVQTEDAEETDEDREQLARLKAVLHAVDDADDAAYFRGRVAAGSVTIVGLVKALASVGVPASALRQDQDDPRAGIVEHCGRKVTFRKVASPQDPTLDAWSCFVPGVLGEVVLTSAEEVQQMLREVWPSEEVAGG